jgi:DNA invertase Pin-like site-specific DNA recombinase
MKKPTTRPVPAEAAPGELLPVVAYLRVSSDQQANQRQRNLFEARCRREGWQAVAVYEETISATKTRNAQRPQLQRAFALADGGKVRKIWVESVSRLGRRPNELHAARERFHTNHVSIYFENYGMETLLPGGKQNPAARMVFAIAGEAAEEETDTMAERLRSGIKAKRAAAPNADPETGLGPWGRRKGDELSLAEWVGCIRRGKTKAGRPMKLAVAFRKALRLLLSQYDQRTVATKAGISRYSVGKLADVLKRQAELAPAERDWLNQLGGSNVEE